MAEMEKLIFTARAMGASDIHISQGLPLIMRVNGILTKPPMQFSKRRAEQLILSCVPAQQRERLSQGSGCGFCHSDQRRQPAEGERFFPAGETGRHDPAAEQYDSLSGGTGSFPRCFGAWPWNPGD